MNLSLSLAGEVWAEGPLLLIQHDRPKTGVLC